MTYLTTYLKYFQFKPSEDSRRTNRKYSLDQSSGSSFTLNTHTQGGPAMAPSLLNLNETLVSQALVSLTANVGLKPKGLRF